MIFIKIDLFIKCKNKKLNSRTTNFKKNYKFIY